MNYMVYPGLVRTVRDDFTIDFFPNISDKRISETVILVTCDECGISQTALFSRLRTGDVVQARMIVHLLLRRYTKKSLNDIGRLTMRNHATVLHSIKTMNNELTYNSSLANLIVLITNKIEFLLNGESTTPFRLTT